MLELYLTAPFYFLMSYKTVKNKATAEITVKKSKFIASIAPVSSVKDAKEFINKIKSKHNSARHNVYAYRIFDGLDEKYSDDGEPSGTSGSAVLSVLKKQEIFDVVVVITRYFGGTLLGTGGLVSAYTKSFLDCLDKAEVVNAYPHKLVEMKLDYETYQIISTICKNLKAKILYNDFTDKITLKIAIPDQNYQMFEDSVKQIDGHLVEKIKDIYIKEN